MRREPVLPRVVDGAALGASTSLVAIALLFFGSEVFGLAFAPFDVFESVTRLVPGRLITAAIDLMVSLITSLGVGPTSVAAKAAEKITAVVAFVLGAAVLGAAVNLVSTRRGRRDAALAAGALGLVLTIAAQAGLGRLTPGSIAWTGVVLLGSSVLLAWALERGSARAAPQGAETNTARRLVLAELMAGSTVAAGGIFGLSRLLRRREPAPTPAGTAGTTQITAGEVPAMPDRIPIVQGTRPELTDNARFYRIDINLEPPRLDADTWRLRLEGLVEHPLALTLAELRRLPSVTQTITLECISNPLGGDLISTTRFTGVPLRHVLRLALPQERARTIQISAADGYFESLAMSEADDERVLLVYAMNGEALAPEHGFPLRIYIPDRHGMKQPKWITRLEVIEGPGRGYWVERGWSKEAIVKTTSVIDTALGGSVGGIAYAGARGISKVEVQVDDGPWAEARLIVPPLGPLTWVLWRHDWDYQPGRHTFRVRAYDGTGALQPTTSHGPRPDGASGIHSLTRTV